MSEKTETIHVRISSGVRVWQVLLVAAALVASLLLGLFIGRASAPPYDAGHMFNLQELSQSATVI
jgi:hypothetical protein